MEKDDATACCRQEPSRRFGDVNEESLLAASIIMIILSLIIIPIVKIQTTLRCIAFDAHPTHQNFFCVENWNTHHLQLQGEPRRRRKAKSLGWQSEMCV